MPPDFSADGDGVLLARVETWPAGGVEVTVRLEDEHGAARTTDESGNFEVSWAATAGDVPQPFAARRRALSPGYLVLLVMPAETETGQAQLAADLAAFARSRPADEHIALYRWGEGIDQLASYTTDRDALAGVLDRIAPRDPGAALATAGQAQRDAVGSVRSIGGEAPRVMRSAIIIADELPGVVPDGAGQLVPVQWLVSGVTPEQLEQLGAARVPDSLSEAAAALDLFAAEAYYDLAVCGVGATAQPARVSLVDSEGELTLVLPALLPEQRGGGCDPDAIVDGDRAYPEAIELVFTAEQRQVYDERVAGRSKADFDVSIRFSPDETPVEATAHLRGKGSIGCERKNYTVNIAGKRPRYFTEGSATDEFYLISMCLDDRYARHVTAYSLMAELGVFPLRFRTIEVILDDETRGVYLWVEKAPEELKRDNGRARSVIRRRFDAGDDVTVPEVKWSRSTDQGAIDAYDALLVAAAGPTGAALEAVLAERMDLDNYLRLLAFNSLVRNGDHVDETWLVSTDRLRADGSVGDWFQVMGWDPDDVFGGCHYSGNLAFDDAYAISYCAEAELDDILLGDPVTYARYVAVLQEVIDAIPPERFRAALDLTEAQLARYMTRPEIAGAMEVTMDEIRAELDGLQADFEARRALYQQRVDMYREDTAQ